MRCPSATALAVVRAPHAHEDSATPGSDHERIRVRSRRNRNVGTGMTDAVVRWDDAERMTMMTVPAIHRALPAVADKRGLQFDDEGVKAYAWRAGAWQ